MTSLVMHRIVLATCLTTFLSLKNFQGLSVFIISDYFASVSAVKKGFCAS